MPKAKKFRGSKVLVTDPATRRRSEPADPAAREARQGSAAHLGEVCARELGLIFRAARVAQARTVASVAAAAGISGPHLSRLERGRHTPSLADGVRLARTLDVPLDDLAAVVP